jgi:hypothetical protein
MNNIIEDPRYQLLLVSIVLTTIRTVNGKSSQSPKSVWNEIGGQESLNPFNFG